ncbi:MAG: rhodanese-like domain-containing protein [Thermodesulfobacteriota bacterium]
MKSLLWTAGCIFILVVPKVQGQERSLGDYFSRFDYQERAKMRISSKELIPLLRDGKVQLVDIRFREEQQAWSMGFGLHIPLNELPNRLEELDRSKLIVTACPHMDRAILARTFLVLKGFQAKYLQDGLLGLADYLRGDRVLELKAQHQREK